MFSRSQRSLPARFLVILTIALLLAACGGAAPEPGDVINQYYTAIENGDADAAAAVFAENAVIVTPNGNVVDGIDAITSQFIPFDLDFMDHVAYQSEFSESNGKITWTHEWHHVDGGVFVNDCEITLENGKIVEWLFN